MQEFSQRTTGLRYQQIDLRQVLSLSICLKKTYQTWIRSHRSFLLVKLHDLCFCSIPEAAGALYVSGFCRWPDCDTVTEDFHSFLK